MLSVESATGLTHCTAQSPLGAIQITASQKGIVSVKVEGEEGANGEAGRDGPSDKSGSNEQVALPRQLVTAQSDNPIIQQCLLQLDEYFRGERKAFEVELDLRGTEFQRKVWEALQAIPFGTTTSYGKLAAQLGYPNAARAVGTANGSNPVWIIVPCHRVIGNSGKLTGYAGGLWRKRRLLDWECNTKQQPLF
jgi:methylated-DNA-[protein]-cysteine S-methyltransferase